MVIFCLKYFLLVNQSRPRCKDLVKAIARTLLQSLISLAVKLWPSQSTSLSVSFLISKIDIVFPALHIAASLKLDHIPKSNQKKFRTLGNFSKVPLFNTEMHCPLQNIF